MDHFTLNRCDFVCLTFYSTKVNFTLNVDEVLPPKHFDLPLAALEMVRELCIRIRIRMEHGGICSNADQDVSETKTLPPRTRRRTPWLNGQQDDVDNMLDCALPLQVSLIAERARKYGEVVYSYSPIKQDLFGRAVLPRLARP